MTKTYTIRHEVYIRVEADNRNEASRLADEISRSIRSTMPTGATLSMSRVVQRETA